MENYLTLYSTGIILAIKSVWDDNKSQSTPEARTHMESHCDLLKPICMYNNSFVLWLTVNLSTTVKFYNDLCNNSSWLLIV